MTISISNIFRNFGVMLLLVVLAFGGVVASAQQADAAIWPFIPQSYVKAYNECQAGKRPPVVGTTLFGKRVVGCAPYLKRGPGAAKTVHRIAR